MCFNEKVGVSSTDCNLDKCVNSEWFEISYDIHVSILRVNKVFALHSNSWVHFF